jgi:pectate lyase
MAGARFRFALNGALALLIAGWSAESSSAVLVAFPGAEGAGAYATGGRNGDVYHVTSLADSGPGTLRNGVYPSTVPRTVVFDVAGTINLLSPLEIGTPNLTIAGQTAPGNGICVTGARTMLRGQNAYIANNTIIRYMRFRLGTDPINNADDSFSISAGNNLMIDHVSASWGSDETLSITGIANNVTVQWSLISEALNANRHGYGSLIAPELPGTRITLHHNLYANDAGRTPRAGTRHYVSDFVFDYRNNVNYNWGTQGDWGTWGVVGGTDNEETLDENFINNYSIAGPNTTTTTTRNTAISSNFATSRFYQSGNLIDSDRDGTLDGTNTEWGMFRGTYTKMTSPFPIASGKEVSTQSAVDAYSSVLNNVGANFPVRDGVDARVIAGVRNQTGAIINTMSTIGGFPTGDYPTIARPAGYDTDLDGMPNDWELLVGLDPNSAADRNFISPSGYTNLEVFLNSLVAAPALPGDYTQDGVVDAADYVQWRKSDRTQFGYDTWRSNFGKTAGIGAGALVNVTVPEPATVVPLMFTMVSCCLRRGGPRLRPTFVNA